MNYAYSIVMLSVAIATTSEADESKKLRELGAGATVLPGVRIGTGVQVGAGAVVSKDLPDFSVAAGVPARVLRMRDTEAL